MLVESFIRPQHFRVKIEVSERDFVSKTVVEVEHVFFGTHLRLEGMMIGGRVRVASFSYFLVEDARGWSLIL